jgi:short-subunit dehydrogenase
MIRVHVLAAHRLAQAAVQSMVPRGAGAIINVSSVASFLASPGNVNYAATKAWQRVFAESVALETAGSGVYVQALCPGYTHTEFHDRAGIDKRKYATWIWMSAGRVVAESLTAMKRRAPVLVVPGLAYRTAAFILEVMPRWSWRALIAFRRRSRA